MNTHTEHNTTPTANAHMHVGTLQLNNTLTQLGKCVSNLLNNECFVVEAESVGQKGDRSAANKTSI